MNRYSLKALLLLVPLVLSSLRAQPASRDSVLLYFCGDVNFGIYFAKKMGDNFTYPFAKVKWLADADITMANLENAMTSRGKRQHKEFVFHTKPKYGRLLKEAGISLVTLANNHIYDYGREGIFDTIELLDSLGIQHVGAGANLDAARAPIIVLRKGLRIGFLGYMDSLNTNNLYFAKGRRAGPAPLKREYFEEDIRALKSRSDFIVVNFHWGVEKSHAPLLRQIELAHAAVDAGADLVIGHHPHVLQGIERYHGRIVEYSLGNFFFGGSSRESYRTALLKVTLAVDSSRQARCEVVPVSVEHWQMRKLEGPDAGSVLDSIREYSQGFEESLLGNE